MSDQPQASQQEIEQARAKAQELADRMKNDSDFAQKVSNDPIGTFQAEGLNEGAAKDLYRESGAREKADVAGFDWDIECYYITCYGTDRCIYSDFIIWN